LVFVLFEGLVLFGLVVLLVELLVELFVELFEVELLPVVPLVDDPPVFLLL